LFETRVQDANALAHAVILFADLPGDGDWQRESGFSFAASKPKFRR